MPGFSDATLRSSLAVAVLAALAMGSHFVNANEPPAGNAVRGKRLMSQYQCGACHVVPGVAAARGTVGPSLADYGLRSYIAGRLVNRPDLLARWIERPSALVPGTSMPDMGVAPQDARDMAAWLSGQRGP